MEYFPNKAPICVLNSLENPQEDDERSVSSGELFPAPCSIPLRDGLRPRPLKLHLVRHPDTLLYRVKSPIWFKRKQSIKAKRSHYSIHVQTEHMLELEDVNVREKDQSVPVMSGTGDAEVSETDALQLPLESSGEKEEIHMEHVHAYCVMCGDTVTNAWEINTMEQFIREMLDFGGIFEGKLVACFMCTERVGKAMIRKMEMMEAAREVTKSLGTVKLTEEMRRFLEKVENYWMELRGIQEETQNANLIQAIRSMVSQLKYFQQETKTRFQDAEIKKEIRKHLEMYHSSLFSKPRHFSNMQSNADDPVNAETLSDSEKTRSQRNCNFEHGFGAMVTSLHSWQSLAEQGIIPRDYKGPLILVKKKTGSCMRIELKSCNSTNEETTEERAAS